MSGYPRTIENGGGEQLTFVGIGRDERGEYLEIRNVVAPGAGPPMHAHLIQEEGMTVERGTMAYQVPGEQERTAGPGESATFAPGVAHKFWNAGDDELVCIGYVRPPDSLEYYLTRMFASMSEHGGKRPGAFDAAYLSSRYGDEFRMLEVPALVQRTLFPIILAAGRLLGWHRRFADAPEPVRRPVTGSDSPS